MEVDDKFHHTNFQWIPNIKLINYLPHFHELSQTVKYRTNIYWNISKKARYIFHGCLSWGILHFNCTGSRYFLDQRFTVFCYEICTPSLFSLSPHCGASFKTNHALNRRPNKYTLTPLQDTFFWSWKICCKPFIGWDSPWSGDGGRTNPEWKRRR